MLLANQSSAAVTVKKAGSGPSPVVKAVRHILDVLMKITEIFGSLLLAIMVIVICWEIFSRFFSKYIPGINSTWTEEVAMVMMVWFGMTGAAIGIRKASHIGVEFVVALFPKKIGQVLAILVDLIVIGFSVFLLVYGFKFAKEMAEVFLTATELSRGYFVYSAVPVAAILMILFGLEAMAKDVARLLQKGDAEN